MSEKGPSILLVEDSEDDVFFFRHTLRKCNSSVSLTVINDGKAAVAHLSDPTTRAKYDLVFLDLKLPFLNGFEVLAWCRSQSINNDLPIYILSGSAEAKDKAKATELGATGYFEKPLSLRILQQILPCPAIA